MESCWLSKNRRQWKDINHKGHSVAEPQPKTAETAEDAEKSSRKSKSKTFAADDADQRRLIVGEEKCSSANGNQVAVNIGETKTNRKIVAKTRN
jgi:hypothetical protein